jgi:adenine C2-methylase RlmN of 23S rRNA A2503 and tRNA A37
MVEYILLGGVNDSVADADALGELFSKAGAAPRFGGRAMVNLCVHIKSSTRLQCARMRRF